MAGYIFSLGNLEALGLYTQHGVYATKMTVPSGYWRTHHEGTFADYATMQEGDNVYFFINRKVYGIGKLVNLETDCKFLNFPGAGEPREFPYPTVKPSLLWDEDSIAAQDEYRYDQRCLCVFEPDPSFFTQGVDIDDVLSSNPDAFKMLRAFWKLSFIKFGDDENQAFRDIILKRNQEALSNPEAGGAVSQFNPCHNDISGRLSPEHHLSTGVSALLSSCADGDRLRHEMAIEAGILHQLSAQDPETCAVFGQWDYLSHQVIASPFKPIDYMDKMDLFGYAYVPGFRPTKLRFLVGELKAGAATLQDVDQLMKYVDWVKDEYCFGDYSMISAYLVTHSFDEEIVQHKQSVGLRKYTVGVRPAQSLEWNNLSLVRYSFNHTAGQLEFTVVR